MSSFTPSEAESLIDKLRFKNESALKNLAKMHLLFSIDCYGDNFSSLFDKEDNSSSSEKAGINDEMIRNLNLLIDFISKDSNITEEGIFRRCGSVNRQQELKTKLNNGLNPDLDKGSYNVHDCATVLKTLLSELVEPLLTDNFFKINCQLQLNNNSNEGYQNFDVKKKLKIFQLLLLLLPCNERKVARALLSLLNLASKHSDKNKMDSRNFATLFAPHLLLPRNLKATEIQQHLSKLTDELQFMIENFHSIFIPPNEFSIDVMKQLKSTGSDEDDDVVNTALTFCDRENIPDEAKNKEYTNRHIAELYAYINNLPESPRKKNLIKQFNRHNGGLTPISSKNSSVKFRTTNAFKTFKNRIRKGLNIFPATKSHSFNKSAENLTDTSSIGEDSLVSSWSSESILDESKKDLILGKRSNDSSCNSFDNQKKVKK